MSPEQESPERTLVISGVDNFFQQTPGAPNHITNSASTKETPWALPVSQGFQDNLQTQDLERFPKYDDTPITNFEQFNIWASSPEKSSALA